MKTYTYTAPHSVTITLPTPTEIRQDQLIKRLEFLQILANKFPEIHGKVVELMEVELDAWWHGTFEEQEGE